MFERPGTTHFNNFFPNQIELYGKPASPYFALPPRIECTGIQYQRLCSKFSAERPALTTYLQKFDSSLHCSAVKGELRLIFLFNLLFETRYVVYSGYASESDQGTG